MLQIYKRLLSAAAIRRRLPPQLCTLPPQLASTGAVKFSILVTCTHSPCQRIKNVRSCRKLVEEEKLGMILQNCKTIKQLKQVHLQILINNNSNRNYCFLADKLVLLSPDEICFDYANRVLMDLPSNPNRLSYYNTLIKCSIGKSDFFAVSAYNRMRNNNNNQDNIIISPDRFTLAFLLKSFASFSQLESGQAVHGHVIKLGFVSDKFVMNSLLDFYFKFVHCHLGRLGAVRKAFEEMPERDIVSWNIMISGLKNNLLNHEALLAFNDLLLSADHRCKPDETTLISMISVCSRKKLFDQGKWLDSYIKENKLALSDPLGNALLTMFVRFGDLGNAKMVFKSMSRRCTLTWEMMMSGLLGNGNCKEVLALFDTMCCCSAAAEEGCLKPNDKIFRLVLMGFRTDERLVGDGERLFRVIHQMVHGFGVKPNREHYDLMIGILSQVGWVEAAMMLAESLPWEPDYAVWGNVLYACHIQGNDNDLLLDAWIRKISDVNSKQDHPRHFMRCTILFYTSVIFRGIPNNDVNYAKSMVESLIRKLPDREYVDELNKNLEYTIQINSTEESLYNGGSSVHARETLPPHDEDDVYRAAESLDRQFLDLHLMINIIDGPCQLGI